MASLRKAEKFEPALFSIEELEFLLDHLGETPNVALHEMDEEGVNPKAIRPILTRFVELDELEKVRKVPWAGYDAIKDSIKRYLDWHNKTAELQEEGLPRHPSQHNFEEDGTVTRGGTGADSSEMVRSEILDTGERKVFTVRLRDVKGGGSMKAPWLGGPKSKSAPAKTATAKVEEKDQIVHDRKRGLYMCGICDEAICTYSKTGGARSLTMAKRKVERHLRTSRKAPARHRAVLKANKWAK